MKKAIATALVLLLTACGYVLVDQKLVDRVTMLESQVQELSGMHEPAGYVTTKPETTRKPEITTGSSGYWSAKSYLNLPCSFVSNTGPGIITITNIEGYRESFEETTAHFSDESSKYYEESSYYWGDESSWYWSDEESSSTRRTDVYERSTVPPKTYRYETTILVEGYVSEDFLASGKTEIHIVLRDNSYALRFLNFNMIVNQDGTFFGTAKFPYSISYSSLSIRSVTAE